MYEEWIQISSPWEIIHRGMIMARKLKNEETGNVASATTSTPISWGARL